MSVVTPQVYRFSPGAKTGVAVVNGVKRCMDAAGTHHWEVVSFAANVSITLRDKLTGQRRLRLVALTSGLPSPSVGCYYSADGGVNESPVCWITTGLNTVTLAGALNGMGTNEAYVVEVEDAVSVFLAKGTDGGTGWEAGAFAFGVTTGRIFSSHNRSDVSLNEGILAGTPGARLVTDGAESTRWFGTAINTAGFGTRQGLVLLADGSWSRLSGGTNASLLAARSTTVTGTPNLLADVGDGPSIERLVPIPVMAASGTTAAGHVAYTRYARTRRYAIGATGPGGGPIANGQIFASAGARTTIGWNHNRSVADASEQPNIIYIWCPPGQETLVA